MVTAYVEDSQLMEKEVDFTCYISDGTSAYSSVNFNQMITKTAVSVSRDFAVPSTFTSGQQYVLQCHADYYNLGSRRDSFYDTFTASTTSEDGGSSGGSGPSAGITGGVVGAGDDEEEKDFGDILDEFNPFSPNRNWAFIFVEFIVIIGLIVFICLCIKKKRKQQHHNYSSQKNWKSVIWKIFLVLLCLGVVVGIIAELFYGFVPVKNALSDLFVVEGVFLQSGSILQDGLFRAMILIAFMTLIIIILFKVLNVRGELKFGKDRFYYYGDRKVTKMQNKLNRMALKEELKRKKKSKKG